MNWRNNARRRMQFDLQIAGLRCWLLPSQLWHSHGHIQFGVFDQILNTFVLPTKQRTRHLVLFSMTGLAIVITFAVSQWTLDMTCAPSSVRQISAITNAHKGAAVAAAEWSLPTPKVSRSLRSDRRYCVIALRSVLYCYLRKSRLS